MDSRFDRIMESPRLPTIPAVAVRIIELVQQPDVSIEQLSETLSADPALAARILKTANSGFYGRPRAVTRLQDAIMVLGLRSVKTLALGFSLVGDLRRQPGSGFDHTAFWQRSLLAGTAARALATRVRLPQPDEAFLGGLLHALGVIALNQTLGEAHQQCVVQSHGDYGQLLRLEQESFGLDHAVVGGALAERWNLPVQLVAALRHFPEPDGAPLDTRGLVRCVAAGADAADLVVGSSPGRSLERFWNECGEWFALATNQADALLPEIVERAAVVTAMLDLPAADLITADEVLSRANEALLQLTLEAEQENVRMAAERDQLEVEASTDGLTGLANRRHLDEFLAEHYRVAARYNTPLSVLLLDLDHFKRLNDAYGHQAGDAVLKATASAVKQEVRDADLVARYGGEEFMVVLPATGEDGALECAERVRAAVQRLRVRLGDERVIGVTASVGVSSYRPGAEMSLERLVRDADMALYKAKSSGRNQVKIARVYGGSSHAA